MLTVAFPHRPGAGGPGAFQERIQERFLARGWKIIYLSESRLRPDAIFVIGGTKRLFRLFWLKITGVPILYRLDGILWIHRKHWPGLKYFLVSEGRNILMKLVHGFFANHVIYQSKFVSDWWLRSGWRQPQSFSVIRNGVDLTQFSPSNADDNATSSDSHRRVICVEGNFDYSPFAIELLNIVADFLADKGVALHLYGNAANPESLELLNDRVVYHGFVARFKMPAVYRSGLYLSLDVNAACPNTVIEAMSSGLPVVGFNTGALAELVPEGCGKVVDYGSDPWELAFPDVDALCQAIEHVLEHHVQYSRNALQVARREYGIDDVAARYARIIEELTNGGSHPG